jgi:hypothetical protein
MIPFLPIWILLLIAIIAIVGWRLIKFAIKTLIIILALLLIVGVIYFLPQLIDYCPTCG